MNVNIKNDRIDMLINKDLKDISDKLRIITDNLSHYLNRMIMNEVSSYKSD